jgi:hypothetical protein
MKQEVVEESEMKSERRDRQSVKKKKSMDNGWYRVEGITSHRINTEGKRPKLELRVNWEGYSE